MINLKLEGSTLSWSAVKNAQTYYLALDDKLVNLNSNNNSVNLTNYVSINEKNEKLDFNYKNFDASTLDIVFSRLADKIDPSVKNKITNMLDENTVLEDKYHQYLLSIISELTSIYEKNKQIDDNLENFKNVCNTYLVNKRINYDKFKIRRFYFKLECS